MNPITKLEFQMDSVEDTDEMEERLNELLLEFDNDYNDLTSVLEKHVAENKIVVKMLRLGESVN